MSRTRAILVGTVLVVLVLIFGFFHLRYKYCWQCTPDNYFARGEAFACKDNGDLQKLGLRHLTTAAQAGQRDALLFLAELYAGELPQGYVPFFPKQTACLKESFGDQPEKSKEYFKQIEALPDTNSKIDFDLGLLYQTGQLSNGNGEKAAKKWFEKAAAQGDYPAMLELAMIDHRQRDYSAASQWFNKAFEVGRSAFAALMLGDYYYYGKGVKTDIGQAISWYKKAGESHEAGFIPSGAHIPAQLQQAARTRLKIAQDRLQRQTDTSQVKIRYRVKGTPEEYLVYLEDNQLLGTVRKQDKSIQATLQPGLYPETIPANTTVSSLNDGINWILHEYAAVKYGQPDVSFELIR